MVGAFITTLLFGLLVTVAQSSQQEQFEKNLLVSQLGSENNHITFAASEELLASGWLRDGTLRNIDLIGANLQGLFLKSADLEGVSFNWANGQGASLAHANLKDANFFAANFCGAVFMGADLQGADMVGVDLRKADFFEANLQGVDFSQSDLRSANFIWAIFDDNTILPNGIKVDINTDIQEQLDIFTNPDNPNFESHFDDHDPEKLSNNPACTKFRPTDLPR
ncbi:MAG: hypothetical protein MHPDNHAH_02802 [Anaerolineales bacterium]|nr:hypothetical protein [Anaerolineales bacterium]